MIRAGGQRGFLRGIRWTGVILALVCVSAQGAPAAAAVPCAAPSSGGEWPVYGHDVANTRTQPVAQGIGPGEAPRLELAWAFSTGSTGDGTGFESTPAVDGGCAFLGSAGGVVYALDASSGHVVWQRKLDVGTPGYGGALVGGPVVHGASVILLVNDDGAPYAVALDRSTGAIRWRSPQFVTKPGGVIQGYYTNASPIVANGLVVAGYSAPEGDPRGIGGFVLIDARNGAIVKVTPTIPPVDEARGYAGGGMWSTPAYDPDTKYVYWGSGNPSSKQLEHPNTNAILKVDLDRTRPTFGRIVAAYKGNVDQYSHELQELSHTPACAATDDPSVPYPLDDPACGQLDLDFGSSANLFTTSSGAKVVGDLQKSGVYHVARAGDMTPVWTALVGLSCQACNAASTAFDGSSVLGVGTPGGTMFSIARDDGAQSWTAPVGGGVHYHPTSVADGVAWTIDNSGALVGFDARDGRPLAHRLFAPDAGAAVFTGGSGGVALAEHTVFAATGSNGLGVAPATGWVFAYRPAG
jgi:polyvinyl alcohol dehydrogenase (cytochrome)